VSGVVVVNQVPVELFDGNGNTILVENGVAIPAGTRAQLAAGADGSTARYVRVRGDGAVGAVLEDAAGNDVGVYHDGTNYRLRNFGQLTNLAEDKIVDVITDAADGLNRLAVSAKVQIVPPETPPAATEVNISADTPLVVNGTDDTFYTVTSAKTFTVNQIEAGAAGDPNEKGSVVEVYWAPNGNTTGIEIIARDYLIGFTQIVTPQTSQSRAGSPLLGDGTAAILVRRRRIGGAAQEIDAVVRGFEE
jgi:hypothetical protein